MNVPPDVIAETRRWLEKAEHDLLAAEHSMLLAEEWDPIDAEEAAQAIHPGAKHSKCHSPTDTQ